MHISFIKPIKILTLLCASLIINFHSSFFNSATAQNVGYTDHSGTVVDVKTGKPLANAKVTHAIGGQTDENGHFTVRFYNNESDRHVIISHPGYYSDTFSYAPTYVSLHRIPSHLIRQNRPKIAVVLSGGGAKGVAHISALRAIEEAGLPIDIICGTSMGALIGGLYSIGWSTDQLDSLVRHQDWTFLLTDKVKEEDLDIDTRRAMNTYPLWHAFTLGSKKNEGAGVFRGYNLDQLFNHLLEGYLDSLDFNDLPIPFACVATDIITNTEIDFHSGYLKQAMRASMSIPGVFAPVRMNNMLLVDGGMRNNYPADIARQMGADIIIGVTVQDDTLSVDDIKGPIELLMQIIDINCKNKYNENLAMSDILMQVNVNGYSATSFTTSSIDTLLRRGAEEATRHKDELLALHKKLKSEHGNWVTTIHRPQIKHSENDEKESFKLTAPNPALTSPRAGVTFRFDNEETGALQIGAQYPFFWLVPMEISSRLRLGKRLHFNLDHKFYPRGFTSPSLSYSFHRNDIDIYDNGVRTYNIKYSQHIVKFTPLNSRFRNYKINAGLRFDYFDYFDPILSSNYNALVLDNQYFFSYFFQSLLNTENDYYFPTSGNLFQIDVSFHTDNFVSFNNKPGIPEVTLLWRVNGSPSDHLTIQPGIFSRMILSDQMPLSYINCLGADQKIVEQQLEFPGIHSLVQVDRYIVGFHLNLQYMFTNKHFILLRSAAARCVGLITDFIPKDFNLSDPEFLYGISLGYAYKSFLGPIKALFGYSSLSPSVNLYISIGHNF